MEYKCRSCGEYFDEPHEYVERHGFDYGPGERWSECPHCGSSDFDYASLVEAEEVDDEEVDE